MLQASQDDRLPSSQNTGTRYIAGLVRLWTDGSGHPWHASIQLVPNGEIVRFADLETLFDYLRAQTGPMIDT
jgi:hypothetical protein